MNTLFYLNKVIFKNYRLYIYFTVYQTREFFKASLYWLKPFTVLTFIENKVLSKSQLLKNKWYYALHSTK